MKLTVSNSNITNTLSTAKITFVNGQIDNSLTIGDVSISPTQVNVGGVSITPTIVSTPNLILGGMQFAGGLQGGIINYQEFTANSTWYNPYANASVNASLTGYEQVLVMVWGGGAGGTSNTSSSRGGGGGCCAIGNYNISNLPNTVSVTVGLGGAATRTTTTAVSPGVAGGNSIFNNLIAYGGGGGNPNGGGGGGGILSSANGTLGGSPLGGDSSNTSTFGGGGGTTVTATTAGSSIFGGGGGSRGDTTANGGFSVFGGGGGSANGITSVGGLSIFGGAGGNNGTAGLVPGGGGSANGTVANTGARGEVRVWVFGPGGTTAGSPTYTLNPNTTTLYEGSSVLYTVSTTNVADGTTLYYTLNNSSTAVSTDFTTAVNGSIIINNGIGTFTLTANNDSTDLDSETLLMDIRTGNSTGSIIVNNGSVNIVAQPSSMTYINYALSGSIPAASTTYTFTNMPIGSPSTYRNVALTMAAMPIGSEVSSVRIDGVQMTQAAYISTAFEKMGIYYLPFANNTTANISIVLSGAASENWNAAIATYSFVTTNNTIATTANSLSTSVTLPAASNDFILAVGSSDDTTIGSFSSINFTGSRDVALDFRTNDAFVSISGRATGTSVTLTNAGVEEIVAVSWKP